MTERLEEIDKFKSFIDSLDDSADADDFHKFIDTCQINYEEGTFNEILRFMKSQAERVQELDKELDRVKVKYRATKEYAYVSMPKISEKNESLTNQNKRYKQALEEIKNNSKHDWDIYDAVAIAIRALEREG